MDNLRLKLRGVPTLIVVRKTVVQGLDICRKSSGPVQRFYSLAWNIGSLIPTLRERKEGIVPLLFHSATPVLLSLFRWLKPGDLVLRQLLDGLLNPFSLDLRAARPVYMCQQVEIQTEI